MSDLANIPLISRTDPGIEPRVRRTLDQVIDRLNGLVRSGTLRRGAAIGEYTVSVALASPSGLEFAGGGLRIDLDTTTLSLTAAGLGFANQTGNTVFASPANGSSGPPLFRSLTANDLPSLAGTYQPFDVDLSAIANLSANNACGVPYRTGNGTWGQLTLGANLTFSAGTVNANVPPAILGVNGIGGFGNVTIQAGANATVTNDVANRTVTIDAVVGGGGVTGLNSLTGNVTIVSGGNVSVVANVAHSNITIDANITSGGGEDYANLPPATSARRVFFPLDQPFFLVSNGTAWLNYFTGQAPTTTPSTATFTTTFNSSGNIAMSQKAGWVEFYSAADVSGGYRRGFVHAAPGGNFTLTVATEIKRGMRGGGTAGIGLCVRRASDGHFIEFTRYQTQSIHQMLLQTWDNATSFSGGVQNGDSMAGVWPQPLYWQRVAWDGTTLTFSFSFDGFAWSVWNAYTVDAYLTGFDQLGLVLLNLGSNGEAFMNLWHYQL